MTLQYTDPAAVHRLSHAAGVCYHTVDFDLSSGGRSTHLATLPAGIRLIDLPELSSVPSRHPPASSVRSWRDRELPPAAEIRCRADPRRPVVVTCLTPYALIRMNARDGTRHSALCVRP